MESSFDPGALLAQFYALPRGPRVCLRLARIRDLPAIRDLFERDGMELEELELVRFVRFDPRRRIVICAMALLGPRETILGVGEIEIGPEAAAAPTHLHVDEQLTDGLTELMTRALVGRAAAVARARAA